MLLYNLFLTCIFQLASSNEVLREFSRSVLNVDTITTRQGVSIVTCGKECRVRKTCKRAIYHRGAAFCRLTSTSRGSQSVIYRNGTVLLSGFEDTDWLNARCHGSMCTSKEACTEKSAGLRECEIRECDNSPSYYTNVLGNLFSVGNKLLLKGRPTDLKLICGQDGTWIPDRSHTAYDCTGGDGIYFAQQGVYCDMHSDGGNWLVFQRRQDGSVDFLRKWIDYKYGFGSSSGEFWLGLEIMYQILSAGRYELRIDMEDFAGEKRFAKYSIFTISSETDYYRLTVSGYSGDAGDSLSHHSGRRFSTFDQDNDSCSCNCASLFSGAWWYVACHASNLNGLYFHGGQNTTQYANHIHWYAFHGYWHSLKMTEMKFRRKWGA